MECATGSMGSRVHRIDNIPLDMMERLASMDWNRAGRRVMIDAARGIICWMSPSSVHEVNAKATDRLVEIAGSLLGKQVALLGGTRWKRPGDPKGTGLEADAAFYIGGNAEAWYAAAKDGDQALLDFESATPPDLVVEVEVTNLDHDKPARYAALGVREMWQVTRKSSDTPPIVHILDLRTERGPAPMETSRLLPVLSRDRLSEALRIARINPRAETRARLTEMLAHGPGPETERDRGAWRSPSPFD